MSYIKNKKFHKIALILSITSIAIMVGIISFGNENITEAQEPSATPDTKELSGYAWSSNVGWISMNCSNTGSCGSIGGNGEGYKVVLDELTGNLTGHAWSSNVGWLQFGGYDTADFPVDSSTQSINANIDTDNGSMNGWARFLGFGDDKLMEDTTTEAITAVENSCEWTTKETRYNPSAPAVYYVHNLACSDCVVVSANNGNGPRLCIEDGGSARFYWDSELVSDSDLNRYTKGNRRSRKCYAPGPNTTSPGESKYNLYAISRETCVSTEPVESLAWDGFVSLSGLSTDGSSYGPTRTDDTLSGYAWGDDVVGWISFSGDGYGVEIEDQPITCGTADGTSPDKLTDTKPTENLCSDDTTPSATKSTNTWIWSCSPTVQCSAPLGWICENSIIPITESCGGCSEGFKEDVNEECVPDTKPTDDPSPVTGEEGEITTFRANPRIINSGGDCNLEWEMSTESPTTVSCEITPEGETAELIDIETAGDNSGTKSFNDVTSSTNYTMSCYTATLEDGTKTKTGDALSTKTAKCIINPTFIEF